MELGRRFRSFGRDVVGADSPLYAQLCELIADAPELLGLAARSPEASPMVFLAAIHDELLRDPDHALAGHYPTVGGGGPGPGLGDALRSFCAERETRLAATLGARRTQTNETARCAALLPAFAWVAGGRPLALIEIGASAGLNGLWDHYAYDYGGRTAGAPSSPVRIACELRGTRVPPLDAPAVSWRVGVDLDPVDRDDPEDVRWLHACLWPDQPARHDRLDAALAVAREHPVEVRRGDALDALPGLLAEAPEDALACVFHTAALAFFSPEQVDGLRSLLRDAAREVAWVGGETPEILAGTPPPGRPVHFALTAGRPDALVQVGRTGHHGRWLEWLA